MITKTNAVKMSIRKWEALAKGRTTTSHQCGFCQYVEGRHLSKWYFSNSDCDRLCPLYPDVCSVSVIVPKPLYFKYRSTKNIATAKAILKAIKERGEKWIKL